MEIRIKITILFRFDNWNGSNIYGENWARVVKANMVSFYLDDVSVLLHKIMEEARKLTKAERYVVLSKMDGLLPVTGISRKKIPLSQYRFYLYCNSIPTFIDNTKERLFEWIICFVLGIAEWKSYIN